MLNKSRKSLITLILVIFPVGFLIFLSSKIDAESVKVLIVNAGIWGPLFVICGIVLGGVIVPLSHLPFTLFSLYFYGFWKTFLLFYIGNILIAPSIDFCIARRGGRGAVRKVAGRETLEQVDKIIELVGWQALVIFRTCGGVLYDVISYAVGLTSLPFKNYFLITAICTVPSSLIMLFVFSKGVTLSVFYIAVYMVWAYLIGIIVLFVLYKRKKQKF